jgi:TolB protein
MKNRSLPFVVIGLMVALALAACCLAGGAGALWAYGRGLFAAGGESTPASEAESEPTPEGLTQLAPAPAHPEQIAFLSSRDNPEFVSDIYLINIDGSGLSEITDSSGLIQGFTWSPDGQRLAFQSDRDGEDEIYVINVDGSGLLQLTDEEGSWARNPAWSPDGEHIAFALGQDADETIFVALMRPDGSDVETLTEGDTPAWSPDGTRIAFAVWDSGLFVMNANGTGIEQSTDSSAYGYDWFPAWSPDGSQILFGSNRQTPGDAATERPYVMNADGTNALPFADMAWGQPPYAWSPDGRRIAYVDDFFQLATLHIMNADGTNRQPLMPDNQGLHPLWRP